MKRIVIRADANKNIGMGHIMRCLSIADAAISAGCQVEFLIADDTVSELIQNRGYKVTILSSDYRKMDEELSSWPQGIIPDLLIVDSYYVTANYLSSLKKTMTQTGGKIIYIDDVLSFPYPVDILIDYNAYATLTSYKSLYDGSAEPQFILGPIYAPLRTMFRDIPKKNQRETVENVLISTGGSDELHLAISILRKMLEENRRDRTYHFLLGGMNTDKQEIRRLAENRPNIVLHENVSDMKSLFQSVDLAISAAGSTLYEICACGVPLITYSLADNQISGAEAFEKLGLGINVGDLRDPDSIEKNAIVSGSLSTTAIGRILDSMEELASDYARRKVMGNRMQKMIDGFGADMMVQEIMHLATHV